MKWKKQMISEMAEAGIEELGMVNHEEVRKLYQQANIFAYPTEFAEIDCISLSKAQAAGAIPITTDFAALKEKQVGGTFIHSDKTKDDWCAAYQHDFSLQDKAKLKEWTQAVIETLKNPPTEDERALMREWAKRTFDWKNIINQWNEVLCQELS